MGLFGKKKKDLVFEGIQGTAVIHSQEDGSVFNSDESTSLADLGIGGYKMKLWLDVTLADGRPTYRVVDKFKVPAKLASWTENGVRLPIYADPEDPNRIEINWDQFQATGGDRELMESRDAEHSAATKAMVREAMPEASRNMMLNGWIQAAKAGAMSPADVDNALQDAVNAGMVTPEEADAARQQIG